MNEKLIHIDLFSGIGGAALAIDTVWGKENVEHIFCDNEKFAQAVLKKHWSESEIWGDIRDFIANAESFILTGGFPCQPFSQAGRRKGTDDDNGNGDACACGNGCDIIEICNGDTTTFVPDAVQTPEGQQGEDIANPVRPNIKRSGERRTSNEKGQTTERGTSKRNTRFTNDMGGNVSVAENRILHSSQSTTRMVEGTRREESITAKLGNSSSKVDTQASTKSSVSTATTPNTTSEPVLINGKRVFLLTGGFPCQPFSQAGRRKGTTDDRYLWPEMLRVIQLTKPEWVVAENVRGLVTWNEGMVFEQVCADLEAEGYEVQPLIIPAVAVNAPHRRDRIWFVAHRKDINEERSERQGDSRGKSEEETGDGDRNAINSERGGRGTRWQGRELEPIHGTRKDDTGTASQSNTWNQNWLEVATRLCGVFNGLSAELDEAGLNMSDGIYSKYAKTLNPITGQDLPCLWHYIQSEAFQWSAGRFNAVQNKDYLFTVLWKYAHRADRQDDLSFESAEVQEAYVRNVWRNGEVGCPPQGWRYNKQYAQEHSDTLPQLSYEVALVAKEVWQAYLKDRNLRLKGLGNAWVPQVAIEIMKAIQQTYD